MGDCGLALLWSCVFTLLAVMVQADLSLTGMRCGQLLCNAHEYCSTEFNRCSPCDQVCRSDNHNYDTSLCESQCQGYIHDLRYVQRSNKNKEDEDEISNLRDTVQKLQFQISVILIISCVVLVFIAIITAIKCWKYTKTHSHKISSIWNRKKKSKTENSSKRYPTDLTHQNPHTESPKLPHKPDLKIDMPLGNSRTTESKRQTQPQPLNPRNLTNCSDATATNASIEDNSTPKTISTTISHRYPAEDSTLDYSYDNMGMAKTPSPNVNPSNESKF